MKHRGLAQSWFISMVKKVQEAEPMGGRGEELDGAAGSDAARPPKFRESMSVGTEKREEEWPTPGLWFCADPNRGSWTSYP